MEGAVLLIIAVVVYLWWKGKIIFNFKNSKFNNSSKIVIEKEIQIGSQTKEVLISLKLEEPITVSTSQEEEETYDSDYAPRNDFLYNYWQEFIEYLHDFDTELHIPENPVDRSERTFSIGRSVFTLYGMIKSDRLTVELYVKDKTEFEKLKQNRESINSNFTTGLQWKIVQGKNVYAKIVSEYYCEPRDESDKDEQFAWLKENLEKFNEVFGSTRY